MLPAALKGELDELAYRVYMTDAMRGLAGGGTRYLDWLRQKPQDARSGDDINRELSQKFGWEVS